MFGRRDRARRARGARRPSPRDRADAASERRARPRHAGDVALRFLGLASHRAALAEAIAERAEDKGEGEAVTARDVLECLVDCMEEEGIKIGGPTALSEDFAAKIGFFPAFGAEPDAGADAGFSGFLERRTDHMSFLAFGGEADHGPGAAFAAVQSWIEAQRPPFPTQEDLLWLQREFGMRSDGTMVGRRAAPPPRGDDGAPAPPLDLGGGGDGAAAGAPLAGLFGDKACQTDESALDGKAPGGVRGKGKARGGGGRGNRRGGGGDGDDDFGDGGGAHRGRGGRGGGGGGDDDSFAGADGRGGGPRDGAGGIKDKDATSNVAVSSVCHRAGKG